ncbi:MAG: hypothetical protein ACRDQ1_00620 [Sciscionella sp.]
MTEDPSEQNPSATEVLARSFPEVGPLIRNACRELELAAHGTPTQRRLLGDPARLPRPWDPPSCADPGLRAEIWAWLEQVVAWLNHEYTWDIDGMIPACWPQHPHLVHEVAVLADQRRRAGTALTSDALEEWHRCALPAFAERMATRVRSHCEEGHQPWPAQPRHTRHTSKADVEARQHAYGADVQAAIGLARARDPGGPRLSLVDLDTGELNGGGDTSDDA